jgi:GntR family transcriptional regulator/MocR family aminotransferase
VSNADPDLPLHERVYQRIRWLVLSGAWPRGTKVPPSRSLAAQMAVSRSTILIALDRVIADGWIRGRKGSGVYVTYGGPPVPAPAKPGYRDSHGPAFLPCARALDLFPARLWNRLRSRRSRQISGAALAMGDSLGWLPLREAIAAHVTLSRGFVCSPDEIIVTTSTPAAIDLVIRALDLSGADAWVEDPGYPAIVQSFRNCGLRLVPVPVDESGIDVACGIAAWPRAKLAIVTPACQFPTCAVMSKDRRAALLAWASAQDSWIVEDDFDWQSTEWQRAPKRLAATDRSRTITVDSFNPILFPALGIAFAVCPAPLVDRFSAMQAGVDELPNLSHQMILTDFLNGGHLDDHLRRLAAAYPERRAALYACLEKELSGIVTPQMKNCGTHVVVSLHDHGEQQFEDLCLREGIVVKGMNKFRLVPRDTAEVVFGCAGFEPRAIAAGATAIRRAVGRRDPNIRIWTDEARIARL